MVHDLGMKSGILRELNERNCDIVAVPHNISAQEVLRLQPDKYAHAQT